MKSDGGSKIRKHSKKRTKERYDDTLQIQQDDTEEKKSQFIG